MTDKNKNYFKGFISGFFTGIFLKQKLGNLLPDLNIDEGVKDEK